MTFNRFSFCIRLCSKYLIYSISIRNHLVKKHPGTFILSKDEEPEVWHPDDVPKARFKSRKFGSRTTMHGLS